MDFIKKIFDEETLEEKTKRIAKNCRKEKPDKVPVLIRSDKIKILKEKYLIPKQMTVGQFLLIIRKNIILNKEDAIYLIFENKMYSPTSKFQELDNGKDYLIIDICKEETYGSSFDVLKQII